MLELPTAEIVPGALLLFRMRTGAVAKHCGIVTLPDRFIHAYERTGVVEASLDAAWRAYRDAWRSAEVRDFVSRCRHDPGLLRHANETWPIRG